MESEKPVLNQKQQTHWECDSLSIWGRDKLATKTSGQETIRIASTVLHLAKAGQTRPSWAKQIRAWLRRIEVH